MPPRVSKVRQRKVQENWSHRPNHCLRGHEDTFQGGFHFSNTELRNIQTPASKSQSAPPAHFLLQILLDRTLVTLPMSTVFCAGLNKDVRVPCDDGDKFLPGDCCSQEHHELQGACQQYKQKLLVGRHTRPVCLAYPPHTEEHWALTCFRWGKSLSVGCRIDANCSAE